MELNAIRYALHALNIETRVISYCSYKLPCRVMTNAKMKFVRIERSSFFQQKERKYDKIYILRIVRNLGVINLNLT